ncbi:MAG: T9SS type A sorting domain-containing protein [Bacteroidales bacterium]|nr:T9SS type A sorting domain-containing protein [Bacteroidales bacterium]
MQAAYETFGCNQSNVYFVGIDKGSTNEAVLAYDSIYGVHYPAASGQNGNGNAVHWTYQLQATPTIVVIMPNREIVYKQIFPPSTENVVDSVTQAGGIPMDCITGFENELNHYSFSIYPNPARKEIFIQKPKEQLVSVVVKISDLSGRISEELTFASLYDNSQFIQADVSDYEPGIYFITVFNNGKLKLTEKLIIR